MAEQIFIGGEWIDSASTGSITVYNPATEEPISSVAAGDPADVDRAVACRRRWPRGFR
jgi:aldehyde dehydrogenase (NAD+)